MRSRCAGRASQGSAGTWALGSGDEPVECPQGALVSTGLHEGSAATKRLGAGAALTSSNGILPIKTRTYQGSSWKPEARGSQGKVPQARGKAPGDHVDEQDHEGVAHQGGEKGHEHYGKEELMGLCVVKEP